MGLFTKLGRRTSAPQEWAQLWELLVPLGGQTTPDAVDRWSRWARALPAETLTVAAEQLAEAYALLDTEQHGRALAVEPFTGLDRPFARMRFLRVLDRVILAGPDAVEKVADAPELVRGYDTVHLLDPDQSLGSTAPALMHLSRLLDEARVLGGQTAPTVGELPQPEETEALRAMMQLEHGSASGGWVSSRRWPTLRSAKASRRTRFSIEDPEIAWIDVDASILCDDESGDAPADHVHDESCWTGAGRAATLEVYAALGGAAGAQHELCHRQVGVEVVSAEDATADGGAPDVDEALPMVLVELVLTDAELAVVDPPARVALLVRRSAERLARTALPWSASNRTALVGLAAGQAV